MEAKSGSATMIVSEDIGAVRERGGRRKRSTRGTAPPTQPTPTVTPTATSTPGVNDCCLNPSARRQWLADKDACAVCSAIPTMNPEGVLLNEPFRSPVGPVMVPGEPHERCHCDMALLPVSYSLGARVKT